ncbi:hypothetical protein B0T16DRAFT_392871 [Cercophora newfieldiana]|uniref:Uncharacterized protein n=1 Tax=Cercophora newfieldiana TaxID=92897 RepID=A0AA40CPI2_9PEZI|nr:hypothetical protein B0T16DRAFT_392871 [Cercophora newfieldiana]
MARPEIDAATSSGVTLNLSVSNGGPLAKEWQWMAAPSSALFPSAQRNHQNCSGTDRGNRWGGGGGEHPFVHPSAKVRQHNRARGEAPMDGGGLASETLASPKIVSGWDLRFDSAWLHVVAKVKLPTCSITPGTPSEPRWVFKSGKMPTGQPWLAEATAATMSDYQ